MRRELLIGAVALAALAVACSSAGTGTTSSGVTEPAATQPIQAAGATDTVDSTSQPPCPIDGEPLEVAKLYVEHNATDEDTGVHGLFGGEAWSELCIWDPNGTLIFFADPQAQLGDLRIADLFFESREPGNDEYTVDDLRASFPAGPYAVGGTDFEGTPRVATAVFTHDIPSEPDITSPDLAEDEESAAAALVASEDLTVEWEEVTTTVFDDPVTIIGYEVIVTKVDHDDPNGLSRPVYDVHVGPETRSLPVPSGFLEPATLYELEVLALEVSGNQTIGLGFFTTE